MTKRHTKKHTPVRHRKSQNPLFMYVRYISFAVVAVAIFLIGKGLLSATNRVHVLGASTGPVLLADHGGDDSGGGGSSGGDSGGSSSGGSASGGGSNSGSGSSSGGSSNSGGGNNHGGSTSGGSLQSSVSDNTQVDCVGPDGKHFTTDFKNCAELNNSWHHSNFSFTPLNTSPQENEIKPNANPTGTQAQNETPEQGAEQKNSGKGESSKFEVKTEDGKTRIDLVQNGDKVHIEQEGNTIKVKAEIPDGTEVKLDTKDSLEAINKELETEGVEVATTDANTVAIKKGGVEAETELPISVDPTTHELTVTTPAGTKTVTVLPDQAVNNLLNTKVLTSIASQASSASGTTQSVTLTAINNEPTFEIQGISQKRVLGIIPVGFAKTEFVSAQTGNVVKADETLLNRILEAISF